MSCRSAPQSLEPRCSKIELFTAKPLYKKNAGQQNPTKYIAASVTAILRHMDDLASPVPFTEDRTRLFRGAALQEAAAGSFIRSKVSGSTSFLPADYSARVKDGRVWRGAIARSQISSRVPPAPEERFQRRLHAATVGPTQA